MSVSLRALIEDRFSYFGEFSFRTMSCTAHCTDYKINEYNLSTKYSHVSTSPWAVNLREIIENTSSKNVRRKRKIVFCLWQESILANLFREHWENMIDIDILYIEDAAGYIEMDYISTPTH